MSTFSILAPAKINLHLDILGKSPVHPCYHALRSLMLKISLYDELSITITKHSSHYNLQGFTIDRAKDILYRSYKLFQDLSHIPFGVDIHLIKKIPQEAGLGGGSADAGAFLQVLNHYFDYPISTAMLIETSKNIGADIPFFIHEASCAIIEGIGEMIHPLPSQKLQFLLIKPQESMPTAYAFTQLAKYRENNFLPSSLSKESLKNLWMQQSYTKFFNHFSYILETNHPQTYHLLQELQNDPTLSWVNMSGSGTTIFALVQEGYHVPAIIDRYQQLGYFIQLVESL